MKKKIAILYSGLPRNFEKCFEEFDENFIKQNKQYDYDIFLTAWDKVHERVNNSEPKLKKYDLKKLIKIFKPKSFKILQYTKYRSFFLDQGKYKNIYNYIGNNDFYGKEFILNSFFMQMYGMKETLHLFDKFLLNNKISYKNYEYIFKNRYDLSYSDQTLIPDEIDKNNLNILNIKKNPKFYGFNDFVAIGDYKALNAFMSSYYYLINDKFMKKNSEEIDFPEQLFRLVLLENKIKYTHSLDWSHLLVSRWDSALEDEEGA